MNRLLLVAARNFWKIPNAYRKLLRYAKHPQQYSEEERYRHTQMIMQWVIDSGNINLEVCGQGNIPEKESFLLYGNHQGMFDVVALAATCNRPLGAVYKKELKNVPILKHILRSTNSFAMDREDIRQSLTVIQNVVKEVASGRNYLIFPEGTRSKNGNQMGDFHSGSFRAAMKAKCPIVPFAFVDSFKVLDQKGCAPVTVKLYYLQPIFYQEYAHLNTVELASLVKERILAAMAGDLYT